MTARPTSLALASGPLALPVFLPDATRGVVRGCDAADLRGVGIRGVVVNAFHLARAPGVRTIGELGGFRAYAGTDLPVFSDSGGFQVLSLRNQPGWKLTTSRKGLRWRAAGDKSRLLSPEKSLEQQGRLGADVMVALDHCTDPGAPRAVQEDAVENTVAWAGRAKAAHDRTADATGRRALLFGVVQGGNHADLRRACVERLVALGVDGLGFGGWPVTPDGKFQEAVALVAAAAPPHLPLWALGVGNPARVAEAYGLGYRIFDCTLPTRDARRGRLFVSAAGTAGGVASGYVYLEDARHRADPRPLDATCDCPACRSHSRAFLHHLYAVGDPLAHRLGTLHNLRHYARLLDALAGGALPAPAPATIPPRERSGPRPRTRR